MNVIKFVPKKYIKGPGEYDKYKVILPKANGGGDWRSPIDPTLVGTPLVVTHRPYFYW